jgi:hypothetical protein
VRRPAVRPAIVAVTALVAVTGITWSIAESGGKPSDDAAVGQRAGATPKASQVPLITSGRTETAAGAGAGGASTPGGPTTGSRGDRCSTRDIKVRLRVEGTGKVLIVLSNTGNGACTLTGNPVVAPLGIDGSRADLPVDWVSRPSGPRPVSLRPGTSAYAGVHFESLPGCEEYGGLAVVPPGESLQSDAKFTTDSGGGIAVPVCDGGLKVGVVTSDSAAAVF